VGSPLLDETSPILITWRALYMPSSPSATWAGILSHATLAIFIASRSVAKKPAGHANANVTLHYRQTAQGAGSAAEALERALGA
jgi:hypothetical protein